MSKFHEALRDVLEDVHTFLMNLQCPLSAAALSQKEGLLLKIQHICQDYPQLQISLSKETSVGSDEKQRRELSVVVGHERTSHPPSSPPPYVDMKGGCHNLSRKSISPEYIYSDPLAEEYEACDKTFSGAEVSHTETRSISESEDIHHPDSEGLINQIPAYDLANSEKCGFLEKKGKDLLGGLLNPFQRKRWYAIKDGILYYYDRPSDRCQKGQISLFGYEARVFQTTSKDPSKKVCCFELVCPGKRTYQFIAQTPKDMKQWIAAIEKNSRISSNNDSKNKLNNVEENSGSQNKAEQKTRSVVSELLSNEFSKSDEDIYEMVDDQQTFTRNQHLCHDPEATVEELYTDAESILSKSHSGNNNLNETFNPQDWYVGLWDCQGDDENELTFLRGQLIRIINKNYDSYAWWIGELHGKIGLVPKTYLMEAYEVV